MISEIIIRELHCAWAVPCECIACSNLRSALAVHLSVCILTFLCPVIEIACVSHLLLHAVLVVVLVLLLLVGASAFLCFLMRRMRAEMYS